VKAVRSVEGGVAVVDVDEPPGAGELLDMRATSICGSDLSYIRFGSRFILGHELAGVREDGTAVVVEAIYGCMECDQCVQGAYNLCATHGQRALGMTADGGMAEQFRAPTARLVPLPPGLDVRDAALVEPASVSWHALRLADTGSGKRVAVVGAGALGLLAVAGACRLGGEEVTLVARHPHQREAGERPGCSCRL
jgi:threonine dehydrogenase-like Zn-dependent dehydrogenase